MKVCVLAVLAYRSSSILFKLLILNDNCLRLACGRKEMKKKKPVKGKRKTYHLFHQKTVFQNECHAKELHILTTLSTRCCKVFPIFQLFQQNFSFEISLLTVKNTLSKRHQYLIASSKILQTRQIFVLYIIFVSLCYNIT